MDSPNQPQQQAAMEMSSSSAPGIVAQQPDGEEGRPLVHPRPSSEAQQSESPGIRVDRDIRVESSPIVPEHAGPVPSQHVLEHTATPSPEDPSPDDSSPEDPSPEPEAPFGSSPLSTIPEEPEEPEEEPKASYVPVSLKDALNNLVGPPSPTIPRAAVDTTHPEEKPKAPYVPVSLEDALNNLV
ncbi:hypothetical protein F4802DRAFT_596880 [Xylaria palmicola]|nr:hypothetical protein F4802DRAFT_596880 [Xylaria palmicola]